MGLSWHIAWRFLLAKRRAMGMSLAGIVFGVAAYIVTQAQTSGFEKYFIELAWATNGGLRVQDRFQQIATSLVAQGSEGAGFEVPLQSGRTYVEGIAHPPSILRAVRAFEEVRGASVVLRKNGQATSGFRSLPTELWGVEMRDHVEVSALGRQLVFGDMRRYEEDPTGALLGVILAERLGVDIGGSVLLEHQGRTRRYRVQGIFETGVEEIDKGRVFVKLGEARRLTQTPEAATFIQVSLEDNDRAPEVARQMEAVLRHDTQPWQEREKSWLAVFRVLRLSSALTMSGIIVISGLGIFNALAILVMERRREIAILRSMGYARREVGLIFLLQGIIVLLAGIVLGSGLGALLTAAVERLPIRIKGIFSTDHFLVSWSVWHYVMGALVATLVVLLASTLPARKASRVEPAEIIRGTSG